jgi:hypothetical protein
MTDPTVDPDKVTLYQELHLALTAIGLIVAATTLIFVGRQVDNLAVQTERQTIAINLQQRSVQGQLWSMVTQNEIELTKARPAQ